MPTDADLIQTIDQLVQATYKADEPGAAVIVVREGEVLYRGARGMAHMELGVPIEPDMVFRIGSITKQFTAVAILMLVEEGKLALDESLTKFLPNYPTHDHNITLEHLLTHTSGIKSYTSMPEWMPLWRKDFSVQEMIDFFKDQPMDFAPGERFAYSNSAYHLLGAIIEKVSGLTYQQFIQQRIFDPLGMTHSYYDMPQPIIPRRVPGYDKGPAGYVNTEYLSMTQPYSAGGLASSVDDLARWDAALYTGQVLRPETLQAAHAAKRLADGSEIEYGYGWFISQFAGRNLISHGGGIPGFLSSGSRLSAERIFVAVLSNSTSTDPSQLAIRIMGWLIGQPFVDPTPIELSAEALARFAGDYESPDFGKVKVHPEDNQLIAQPGESGPRMALVPFSTHEFFLKDRTLDHVVFTSDAEGAVTGFEIRGPLGKPMVVKRVAPASEPN